MFFQEIYYKSWLEFRPLGGSNPANRDVHACNHSVNVKIMKYTGIPHKIDLQQVELMYT